MYEAVRGFLLRVRATTASPGGTMAKSLNLNKAVRAEL